ncbi:hypothetical protein ACOI1H_21615 [Loktanella sp. DJP18]|uniref:hypothetical protein n=1 Tax=Loktanella sp. DJP18 TaxID=3409788 RepID=UPI003BB70905
MAKPASLAIWWSDALYGLDLTARIDVCLNEMPDLVSIVNTSRGHTSFNRVHCTLNLSGAECILRMPDGVHLSPAKASQPCLLPQSNVPTSDHEYRKYVWVSEQIGVQWRMFLHRDIVFVLPAASAERRKRSRLEKDGVVILKRPTSAHERIGAPALLARISEEASDLIRWIWKDGVRLIDREGILPGGSTQL